MRRTLVVAAVLAGFSQVASAYYHWTFFTGRGAPFQGMRLRFDVNALPDGVVPFFIAKQGPSKMVGNDNFTALVSQIRRAGETWNVPGSALQLRFGGLQERTFQDALEEQKTPAIDVVFNDELPPGVLALSEPQTYTDLAYLGAANGPGFAPIVRSRLQLASDLTTRGQASYSDAFFLTIVHEFGHALGLQHSMTGGAMATSITRGTSKAMPLAADDIAGISALYPTPGFKRSTGSITGFVNVAGTPANLASVVALAADGTAIGTMSLPDGTYRIEGLPAGDYLVYTHPLPPAQFGEGLPAGIVPPRDLQHAPFPATTEFQTRFFPGTKDWKEATRFRVDPGKSVGNVNFVVQPATGAALYNLRMFGYLGAKRDTVVQAPPLPPGFSDWLAFSANGAQVPGGTAIAQGLQLSAISETVALNPASLRNFPGADQFLLIAATAGAVSKATPVAVSMTAGDNLYVLPGAFSLVSSKHPAVTSVTAVQDEQGLWTAEITGENLTPSTKVTFDGANALSVRARGDGSLVATAPAAAGRHSAVVELFSADGQTSWQLQGTLPPAVFQYDAPVDPIHSVLQGGLLAGTNSMVEIEAGLTNFVQGDTVVGFGTSDVAVRQVWVVSPTRILANVSVDPKAKLGNFPVTISTGLQLVTLGAPLQIRPAEAKQTAVQLPIVNEATGLPGIPAGGTLSMRVAGLPNDLGGWSIIVGGLRMPLTLSADGRLTAPVPTGLSAGPETLQLVVGDGSQVAPVLFQLDAAPPVIAVPEAKPSLRAGDRLVLSVSNLLVINSGDGAAPVAGDVVVRIAGVEQRLLNVEALADAGTYRVEFAVASDTPLGDSQPVSVGVRTRVSAPITVSIIAP